jgi:DNA-directed RNA polymerase beta subunit/DNA-directed RNA polymerase beta' subunit
VGTISLKKLRDAVKAQSVSDSKFSVNFDMSITEPANVKDVNGTKYFMLKLLVSAKSHVRKDEVTFPIDVLKVPHETPTGFVVKGKDKQVVDIHARSVGWYIMQATKSFDIDTAKLQTEGGPNLTIFPNKSFELRFGPVSSKNDPTVPLAVLLKAITGESYSSLLTKVGEDSVYAQASFGVTEPSRAQCISLVFDMLFRAAGTDGQIALRDVKNPDEKFEFVRSWLLSGRSVYPGEISDIRLARTLSFAYRCRGMYLKEEVNLAGYNFAADSLLSIQDLEILDYLPVDSIKVYSSDKVFTVRKYLDTNFRALGMTLNKKVDLPRKTLEVGTVLDLDMLKELTQSKVFEIEVKDYKGSVKVLKRRQFDGMLKPEDIIAIVQVFLNSLSGMNLYDDTHSYSNQNLISLNTLAAAKIKSNCAQVIDSLFGDPSGLGRNMDLFSKVANLQPLNTESLLEFILDPKNRGSQQAELNNTTQKLAKDFRLNNDAKRSSDQMRSVQDSQFGRVDSVESPESSKVGMTHSRTITSIEDDKGFILAPLIMVRNGIVQDPEPVYLSREQEEREYIAEWNETFHEVINGKKVLKSKIMVRSATTFIEVPTEDVRYMQYSCFDDISPSRGFVTFPQNSQPKRQLMGANQARQVVTLILAERMLVATGAESLHQVGFVSAEQALKMYYYSQAVEGETEQEFCQRTVRLKHVTVVNSNKVIELSIDDFDGPNVRVEIPFIHKASSGALYTYEISARTNGVYTGRDIIAKSSDINIDKLKMEYYTDFGHMKIDKQVFETQAISTSRNFYIAWKTHQSSTQDDSIVLSDELVGMHLTTSMDLFMESYELPGDEVDPREGTVKSESFGTPPGLENIHIQVNGLPRVGTRIKAGGIVIGVKSEVSRLTKTNTKKTQETNRRDIVLSSRHEGQVVSVKIEGRKATVLLAIPKDVEVGDKYAGRHGNKGVVGCIVPRYLMPYCPKTGRIVQMILNLLGIPSRINLSQLLEGAAQFAMFKQGKHAIISPFLKDSTELVKRLAEENDIRPTKLIDGRTGQYFKRPINTAFLYMWPLEHKSSHKSKYVGLDSPLDPVFCQPSKGDGGQAIGEMETWALRSAGALKVLDDIMSVQSDDLLAQTTLRHSIEEDPVNIDISGENHNDLFFQALLRGLGTDPQNDKDGNIVFGPLTDSATKALYPTPLDIYNKKSLRDPRVFGAVTNSKNRFNSRDRWGWINLKAEIVHPFFLIKGDLHKLMVLGEQNKQGELKLISLTEDFLWKIAACKEYVKRYGPEGVFAVSDAKDGEAMTGFSAVCTMLRETNLQNSVDMVEDALSRAKSTKSILAHKRKLFMIRNFQASGIQLSDYIITSLPVLPLAMRPPATFERREQDFDYYYKGIMDEVLKYSQTLAPTEKGKFEIFLRIGEFAGLKKGKYITSDKNYKPLLKYFTQRESPENKHGHMRESLIKKRQGMSGRTPIIPSRDPSRSPMYIGLPWEGVFTVWRAQLSVLFTNYDLHGGASVSQWESLLKVAAIPERFYVQFMKMFDVPRHIAVNVYKDMRLLTKRFIEGYEENGKTIFRKRVVLAGRQPTLHVFNIRAYFIKIVEGKCIEVPPLVCPLYNADFDGDQMWFVALMNWEAMDEAMRLLSVERGIINPKDGSILLNPAQDMRLGMYFATMLHDNVDHISKSEKYNKGYRSYKSLAQIDGDLEMGNIEYHDLASVAVNGRFYLSTAGRLAFHKNLGPTVFTDKEFSNPLEIPNIPEGVFSDLMFDGLVSGNGGKRKTPKYTPLSNILKYCTKTFNAKDTVEAIHKMSEFGFKASDISGMTLSMEDFVQYPSTQKHIDEAKVYSEEINRRYLLGMLSEEERKEEMIYLYTKCKEKITKSFLSQFDRNNNLFIIFDSGSRGNEGQIIQSVGIIGILKKTKDEALEVPVLTNYFEGLSAFNILQATHSTRVGVSSSQNETKVSGTTGRLTTYMAGGIEIVMGDCGADYHEYIVESESFTGKVRNPAGEVHEIQILLGKTLGEDERAKKYLKNFLGSNGEVTEETIEILIKSKLKNVTFSDGVYNLLFNPNSMVKDLLLYRKTDENLPGLIQGSFMGEESVKHILKSNKETIRMRTMLDCKAVGGVCAHCYGLTYDDVILPPIGKNIGVESAGALSEPAAQLNLDTFHSGGVAGKSSSRGVETLASLLSTGFGGRIPKALLAKEAGYVTIAPDNRRFIITPEGAEEGEETAYFTKDKLIVKSGQYVNKFTPLTEGARLVSEPMINPSTHDLREMQLSLLEAQFRVFEANSIEVYPRHFEVFAKVETSLCDIIESDDPKFPEGGVFEIQDVLHNHKGTYSVQARDAHADEVISHFGGALTGLAYRDLATKLGKLATFGSKTSKKAFLGNMLIGHPLGKEVDKIFVRPYVEVRASSVFEESHVKVAEASMMDSLVKSKELPQEIDLGDFSFEDLLGEQPVELHLDVETPEEEEQNVSSSEVKLEGSNAFGGG